jgi:hypothetical protein
LKPGWATINLNETLAIRLRQGIYTLASSKNG